LEEESSWQHLSGLKIFRLGRARILTTKIYSITGAESFARYYGLKNQIQRASVSVMANIAEGFGRHSDKDFANFLTMAHASVSEVQSHLYVALDLKYVTNPLFEELYRLLDEIGKMTFRLAVHLRTNSTAKSLRP
jgi:four helix bundle protein